MSPLGYSGLSRDFRSVCRVVGVPVSVSVISSPCTFVTAFRLRSGSIRVGLPKSIVPPSSRRYRRVLKKIDPPSPSVVRPVSAGRVAVPTRRRSARTESLP